MIDLIGGNITMRKNAYHQNSLLALSALAVLIGAMLSRPISSGTSSSRYLWEQLPSINGTTALRSGQLENRLRMQ
jgi:hypothetical protein